MAFKIFNIGKANARIDELEAQVATLTTQLAEVSANPVALESELTQTKSDLALARQNIGTQNSAAISYIAEIEKLTTDLAARDAQLAAVPAQVEVAAAAKSVQIVASQGIPPIAIKVEANPASTAKPVPTGMSAKDRLKLEHAN